MDTEIYQLNYFIYCNETTGTNILMNFGQKSELSAVWVSAVSLPLLYVVKS